MSFTVEVVCATSLDGKISTPDRRPWRWSDPADHEWLLSRMAEADLLAMGAGTIRSEDPTVTLPERFCRERVARGLSAQPARLVLTPSMSLKVGARVVSADAELLVAARSGALRERFHGFPSRVRGIEWGEDLCLRPVLEEACRLTGAKRILSLGGGRTNATFLEEDLVDTLSLTISSFVIGAKGAPGPFDGRGFSPREFPRFRLLGTQPAGADIVLRYERDRAAAGRDAAAGLD